MSTVDCTVTLLQAAYVDELEDYYAANGTNVKKVAGTQFIPIDGTTNGTSYR